MDLDSITKSYDKFLIDYESEFEHALESIILENITLADALKNQLQLQMKWEILSKRIDAIFHECENIVETSYSSAISSELRDSYKSTTITEAKEFAKSNADYLKAKKAFLKIRHTKEEVKGILETVNSRKYILNNLTNSIVAGAESTLL